MNRDYYGSGTSGDGPENRADKGARLLLERTEQYIRWWRSVQGALIIATGALLGAVALALLVPDWTVGALLMGAFWGAGIWIVAFGMLLGAVQGVVKLCGRSLDELGLKTQTVGIAVLGLLAGPALVYWLCIWLPSGDSADALLPAQETDVTGVAMSPDDRHVLTVNAAGVLRLWDLQTRQETRAFHKVGQVAWIGFSDDGRRVMAGLSSVNSPALAWDRETGNPVETPTQQAFKRVWLRSAKMDTIVHCPDKQHYLVAGYPRVSLMSEESKKEVRRFEVGSATVSGLVLAKDGSRFVAISQSMWSSKKHVVRAFDVRTAHELRTFTYTGAVDAAAIAVASDGRRLLTCTGKVVQIWNITD